MKLTDTQLVMMSNAAQRDDLALERPETLRGNAPERSVAPLLREGLVTEAACAAGMPIWRRDKGEAAISLFLTRAGLAALGVAPEEAGEASDRAASKSIAGPSGKEPNEEEDPATAAASPGLAAPAPSSKLGEVLALLRRDGGASLDDMIAATGWQAHSVRAALTGLRKRGFAVMRDKADGTSRYKTAAATGDDPEASAPSGEAGPRAPATEA